MLLLGMSHIGQGRERIRSEVQERAHDLVLVVRTKFEHESSDPQKLNEFLQGLAALSGPADPYVRVYQIDGAKGKIMASSHSVDLLNKQPSGHNFRAVLAGGTITQTKWIRGERRVETIEPLRLDGSVVAAVGVYSSLRAQNTAILGETKEILIVTFLGASAQLGALWLVFYLLILRRTRRLAAAAERVAAGDLNVRVPDGQDAAGARDELTKVAREFDRMIVTVRDRSAQQEAITELGRKALAGVTMGVLMKQAVEVVVSNLELDGGSILELLPNGFVVRAGVGLPKTQVGEALLLHAETPEGYAVLRGEPAVTESLAKDKRFSPVGYLHSNRIVGSISTLIAGQERPYGVLGGHSRRARRFSTHDIQFLQGVANLMEWTIRHRRSQSRLRESEERFRSLAQHSSDVVSIVESDSAIRYISPAVESILGYPPSALVGSKLLDLIHPDDAQYAEACFLQMKQNPGSSCNSEWRLRHRDGRWRYLETLATNLTQDPNVAGFVLNSRDVTDRKVLEEQLIQSAFHDPLTKLANRALFADRVQHALARTDRKDGPVAVLFVDLDDFKVLNDTFGEALANDVLLASAEKIQMCLRPGDTAARAGGDEFAVLLEDIDQLSDAPRVAERILEALRVPFTVGDRNVFLSACVGIAIAGGAEGVEEMIRNADIALSAAKSRGRGHYELFQPKMHADVLARIQLESDLRRAVERDEFVVQYQPIVDLGTTRVRGMEALVRWIHPIRGPLQPLEFIPLAEETGLIVELGNIVLGHACRQARAWERSRVISPMFVSVNISINQLKDPGLLDVVRSVLERTSLSPHRLVLELTESVLLEDADAMISTLHDLRGLGVRIAIDDFGTGYSSLSYLRDLPVSILKIDKAFVDHIDAGPEDSVLAKAIVKLGETLHLEVIAEGIETIDQVTRLREIGCPLGQGYFFARPLDKEKANLFLIGDRNEATASQTSSQQGAQAG